jgi:hypothetical protein
MQFRKWMRPGWTKRFGYSFGKSDWNERRSQYSEGMYVSTWNFFTMPIQDNYRAYINSKKKNKESDPHNEEGSLEQVTALKAISNIITDYGKFFGNARLYWHTLNETQKANVIRTMLEYSTFATSILSVSLLKNLKGEDEENFALMLLMYQLDRTATELTTYVPLAVAPKVDGIFVGGGWFNEAKKIMKSPAAVFGTMEHLIKLIKEGIAYPFSSEEDRTYQTGVYHGESKLSVLTQKSVPMWNQWYKTNYLGKNYKYYKLF